MVRGAFVLIVLVAGLTALVAQTWRKTMTNLEQRMNELYLADTAWRSGISIIDDAGPMTPMPPRRSPTLVRVAWKTPLL